MSTVRVFINAGDQNIPFGSFVIPEVSTIPFPATNRTPVDVEPRPPGFYHLQIQAGVIPDWSFGVDETGHFHYEERFNLVNSTGRPGFLEGEDTNTLTISGYDTVLDARALFGGSVTMNVLDHRLGDISLRTVRLPPQKNYQVIQGSGTAADFRFEVTLPSDSQFGGRFIYDQTFDVCSKPRGFLSGQDKARLEFIGYPLFIEACVGDIKATRIVSNIQQIEVNHLQVMSLLPGTFSLRTLPLGGTSQSLEFSLNQAGNISGINVVPPLPLGLAAQQVSRPGIRVDVL